MTTEPIFILLISNCSEVIPSIISSIPTAAASSSSSSSCSNSSSSLCKCFKNTPFPLVDQTSNERETWKKHEKLISDTSAQAEHLRIAVQTFGGHFQRCNYFHKFFNTMSTDLVQCNCRSSSRLSNREKIRRHSVFPDEFNVSYCSISKLSPL
ncbi:hypothetical protein T09_1866 [Trichinella sp. T9]|nr:hypothetical protein T09_1866 [Trichinella sp. T9]